MRKSPYRYYCIYEPQLSITSPTSGTKFVFNTDSTSILTLPVSSTPSGEYNLATITWNIDPITGSTRTSEPTGWTGGNYTYSGLPSLNISFGQKTIDAEVKIGGGQEFAFT